jgi:hypothetical protein
MRSITEFSNQTRRIPKTASGISDHVCITHYSILTESEHSVGMLFLFPKARTDFNKKNNSIKRTEQIQKRRVVQSIAFHYQIDIDNMLNNIKIRSKEKKIRKRQPF